MTATERDPDRLLAENDELRSLLEAQREQLAELREQLADFREAFAMPDETCEAARIRWHSWQGLMALLDLHWPADIFPTTRCLEEPERDDGPRIVALMRWVAELRASRDKTEAGLARFNALVDQWALDEMEYRNPLGIAERLVEFGLRKPAAAAPSQEGESDG